MEKKIGFLKTHNRICVALSRARCGLFVIGNMTLLADVEDMWKNILKTLFDTNEIGKGNTKTKKNKQKITFNFRFISFMSSTFKRKIYC